MVVLSKIYTRTGDEGTTALGDGTRVAKTDARVEAYGTVDEANAMIGMARLHTAETPLDAMLEAIQNDLFDLGADLATPESDEPLGYEPLRITAGQVERIEADIDTLNADLSPLRSFVLPGGGDLSAALHLARTVTRRAERRTVELATMESVNEHAVTYVNRLSDWLFVASRVANEGGAKDVLWVAGKNR